MMYKRRARADSLCVLRIERGIAALPGVVLSDQNAASDYVRFLAVSQDHLLNYDDIYAMDWRHPNDQIAQWRHSSRKCAECLVPQRVEPRWLTGAYVVDQRASRRLVEAGFTLPLAIDSDLFFR